MRKASHSLGHVEHGEYRNNSHSFGRLWDLSPPEEDFQESGYKGKSVLNRKWK